MNFIDVDLERVRRHVQDAERRVLEQQTLIANLRLSKRPTHHAEILLDEQLEILESMQQRMQEMFLRLN